MYQPSYFKESNQNKALSFIKGHPFATLISGDSLQASHLPILPDVSGTKLITHLAEKNPLANLAPGQKVIAIFQGPHAYISPGLYSSDKSVPTWNYIAVHIIGRVTKTEQFNSEKTLMALVEFLEPDYKSKWQNLSDEFKSGLMRQMRPLEIEIVSIEMASKLSQNKSKTDREKIVKHLLGTNDSNARELAKEMEKNL